MANSCPECGSSIEFEDREVRLKTGVCPSCSKEFAFVEGSSVSARLGSPPRGAEEATDEAEAAEEVGGGEGPECEECGSPLSFRPGPNGSIEVSCPECETTSLFVPKSEQPHGPVRRERTEAPGPEVPRGRPCRKCGAPLRFSTGEDGLLVGECDNCGNRFTLPPRQDRRGGGRDFRGGGRFRAGGFRPDRGRPQRARYRREGGSDRQDRDSEGGGRRFYGNDERRSKRRRRRDE